MFANNDTAAATITKLFILLNQPSKCSSIE